MYCYDPSEQVFKINNTIISIDWGKNGDKAVKLTSKVLTDGTICVTKVEEIIQPV